MARHWQPFLVWTGVACLVAGVYGMLHNQVSYTISSELFYHILFPRLNIPEAWYGRGGATIVGWISAWWTGLLFGPPMVILALRRCRDGSLTRVLTAAFIVAVVWNVACEFGALCAATMFVTEPMTYAWRMPAGVEHRVAFARAGIMHDASYAGGLLATIAGCITVVRMTPQNPSESP